MLAILALLPSVAVLVCTLALRASGLVAAGAALATTLLVWLTQIAGGSAGAQVLRAIPDAGILTLIVAAMVVPGLLFVEATRRRNAPEAIGTVIASLSLTPAREAILVAVGVGVAVESLTGMGVSLLVTVPILLRLTDQNRAIGLALVGMSLMPWGALAISAHVGSKLAGLPMETFAHWVSIVSGPIAFVLPWLCVLLMGAKHWSDHALALLAGAVLWAALAATTYLVGIELAGAMGGLAVIVFLGATARERSGLELALKAPGLRPYLWLLGAVILQKLALALVGTNGRTLVVATDRVSFSLLTSPGVALLAATLLAAYDGVGGATIRTVVMRAWRPVASIAIFMLSARLLTECGAIDALAGLIKGLGAHGAVLATVLLGAMGGFITGSGVTSSALFMTSATAAGTSLGQVPLFAALQNGAGGHVAMASLPVAALLLASLPNRGIGAEATTMHWGLFLAACHVCLLAVTGILLVHS